MEAYRGSSLIETKVLPSRAKGLPRMTSGRLRPWVAGSGSRKIPSVNILFPCTSPQYHLLRGCRSRRVADHIQVQPPPVTEQHAAALTPSLSLDNARRYTRERTTALALQRSLLPQRLARQSAVEVASRYLPASANVGVGGDWFDVMPLSGLLGGDFGGAGEDLG